MNLLGRLTGGRAAREARAALTKSEVIGRIDEDVRAMISRGRFMGDRLELGPNFVHAFITRGPSGIFGPPGEVIDLGWSRNLSLADADTAGFGKTAIP